MIEEYNDNKSYKHEEQCRYEGKIYRASCYSGLNGQGGITGISPKEGEDSFWVEEGDNGSLEDEADSAFNAGIK
tara:strand:- start:1742 stop:1963 length:222 start_codon:yes stop_codon:yes gene_type:complete